MGTYARTSFLLKLSTTFCSCFSFFIISGRHLPEFLLPFRNPKRIRTTFSPSQMLKLEQAFDNNQYMVGTERKELAKHLNISETQVRIENDPS